MGPTVNIWPPACNAQGCVSHLTKDRLGCSCPRWFDSGGTHIAEMNPACPEHVVESHVNIEHGRSAMEFTDRALGYTRDV